MSSDKGVGRQWNQVKMFNGPGVRTCIADNKFCQLEVSERWRLTAELTAMVFPNVSLKIIDNYQKGGLRMAIYPNTSLRNPWKMQVGMNSTRNVYIFLLTKVKRAHCWNSCMAVTHSTYSTSYMTWAALFIISQTWEQVSFDRWMVIQTMVYPRHGIVLSNEEEQIMTTCHSVHRPPGHDAERKKPISKGHTQCDSMDTTFWSYRTVAMEHR